MFCCSETQVVKRDSVLIDVGNNRKKEENIIIDVLLIFTLYSLSDINNYSKSATINFQLDFLYKKDDFKKYKFVPLDDNGARNFPFILINACGDFNIIRKITGEFIHEGSLEEARLYVHKKVPDEYYDYDDNIVLYESYHIISEIKLINKLNLTPFNSVYVPIHISTSGYLNCEYIRFLISKETSFGDSWMNNDAMFFSIPSWEKFSDTKYVRTMTVENCVTDIQKTQGCVWPRAYFLVKFEFNANEDILKYFIIPTMFNNMLITFSTLPQGDFLSLFTTFCLSDIALLFTMPETKCLTVSETSVISDVVVSIFLTWKKWFSNAPIPSHYHYLPSLMKGVLLIGSKIWAFYKKQKETMFLSDWKFGKMD